MYLPPTSKPNKSTPPKAMWQRDAQCITQHAGIRLHPSCTVMVNWTRGSGSKLGAQWKLHLVKVAFESPLNHQWRSGNVILSIWSSTVKAMHGKFWGPIDSTKGRTRGKVWVFTHHSGFKKNIKFQGEWRTSLPSRLYSLLHSALLAFSKVLMYCS